VGLFSLTIGSAISSLISSWIINGGWTTIYYGFREWGVAWWFLQWPVIFCYQVKIHHSLFVLRYSISVIGYPLNTIGYQLLANGYPLSTIGYWLSAISYRLSAIFYRVLSIRYTK
jgi:hypothetical protein